MWIQDAIDTGDNVLKIIDRIYCSIPRNRKKFKISSTIPHIIPVWYCLSYHTPVVGLLHSLTLKARPSMYRLNIRHLQDPHFLSKLADLRVDLQYKAMEDNSTAKITLASSKAYIKAKGWHALMARSKQLRSKKERRKSAWTLQQHKLV